MKTVYKSRNHSDNKDKGQKIKAENSQKILIWPKES